MLFTDGTERQTKLAAAQTELLHGGFYGDGIHLDEQGMKQRGVALVEQRGRFDGDFTGAAGCALFCCAVQDFFCVALCLVTPMVWLVWALMESDQATELPEIETE